MAEIKRVTVKHEAIMDFMMMNPTEPLGKVAMHFGVSQPWLSTIIHSDAFQNQLKEKSAEFYTSTVMPLREQLMGVARVGVEKLGQALENASPSSDKEFISSASDLILKNLGFAPKSTPNLPTTQNVQNNIMVVDKTALEAARDRMRGLTDETLKGETLELTQTITAEAVQTSGADREG